MEEKKDTKIKLEEMDLYVTRSCNLRCGFCSVDARPEGKSRGPELTLEEIKRVVREGLALGLEEVHITGGEPCIRGDLEEIVLFLSRNNVKTRLITNGTLLTREKLNRLKKSGLKSIMFSMDGLPETHDRMRGVHGAWDKTLAALDAALDIGFTTRVSAVAFKDNLPDILPLVELLAKMGVHIFSLFLGSPLGRGEYRKHLLIEPAEWYGYIDTLKARVNQIDGKIPNQMQIIVEQGYMKKEQGGYDPCRIKGRGTGCRTLVSNHDYIIIKEDGELFPCVFFIHHGPSLGNIKNGPLERILEQASRRGDYEPFSRLNSFCTTCPHVSLCWGGCRGYAYLYSSEWHVKDPRCQRKTMECDAPAFFPLCPIAKLNIRSEVIQGSSEHALNEIHP